MNTEVHLAGYRPWWLIEEPRFFIKRWQRAWRRNKLFEVRYAGRILWVNPNMVMYVWYRS